MVFILVFATVFLLIAVDYFVRREERKEKEEGDKKRSPIFLAPEKALLPLEMTPDRAYHLSHTWVQHAGQDRSESTRALRPPSPHGAADGCPAPSR